MVIKLATTDINDDWFVPEPNLPHNISDYSLHFENTSSTVYMLSAFIGKNCLYTTQLTVFRDGTDCH